MSLDPKALSGLHMWEDWQKTVEAALPNFAANPIYVEQLSPSDKEFDRVAKEVSEHVIHYEARLRDVEFGGVARDTTAFGPVTRMWLDANIELDFLLTHFPFSSDKKVLEVGAGYGRLAVIGRAFFARWACVDAVPISTKICREYCGRFNPKVEVASLDDFCALAEPGMFDLAVNIHSWNECSVEQVKQWLDALVFLKIPYLFTVSHGQLKTDSAYKTQEPGQPSFRHLLTERYDLIVEESIGLGSHPHAIWKLK